MQIDFTYKNILDPIITDADGRKDSTNLDQRDKEKVHIRTNFIESFIIGMQKYGMFTNTNATPEHFFPTDGSSVAPSTMTNPGEYMNSDLSATNIKSLIVNADPTITKALIKPRNYETSVTLPKVDLTKPFINNFNVSDGEIKHSGDFRTGFNLTVQKDTKVDMFGRTKGASLEKVKAFAESLATANTARGFFKNKPVVSSE